LFLHIIHAAGNKGALEAGKDRAPIDTKGSTPSANTYEEERAAQIARNNAVLKGLKMPLLGRGEEVHPSKRLRMAPSDEQGDDPAYECPSTSELHQEVKDEEDARFMGSYCEPEGNSRAKVAGGCAFPLESMTGMTGLGCATYFMYAGRWRQTHQ
jgi:hypothetical protein